MIMLTLFLVACAQATPAGTDGGGGGGDDDSKADAWNPPDAVPVESDCIDKVDNDGDQAIDCADSDCSADPTCQPESNCANNVDDESDGVADCADPDCDGRDRCEYGVEASCGDAFDNDADGDSDCADSDCDGVGSCEYGNEASCSDDVDNDGDELTDCADPDCAGEPTCNPETNCTNGLDDDDDTTTDCADFDCSGVGICEFATELSCDDAEDNDGDLATDCDDSDCTAAAGCAITCPTGSFPVDFVATGLPLAIPDSGAVAAPLSVAETGIIRHAVVRVTIAHSFVGDLVLTLQPPSGDDVVLSERHGSTGEDYSGTLFSDDASTDVAAAAAPFAGAFRPDQALAGLAGNPATGSWNLHVADEASLDSGTIEAFTLYLCTCDGTPGCELGAACQDGADNDGDLAVDCDDADCAAITQCIPESACLDGQDNDLDGDTDCADDDCATVCAIETDCHDDIDNDSDGFTDCQDVGCDADPTCQRLGEQSCNDAIDNDSDGAVDCDDPDCALACTTLTCAGGDIAMVYSAADLPRAIADTTTTTSTIPVTTTGTVASVAVRFSATHTFTGDLDISLRSPTGTITDLCSDNGSSGDDFTDTIFVDTAATAITAGTAPFTGSFRPETALAGLSSESVTGSWSLDVYDDSSSDSGSLTQFDLVVCVSP